MSETEQEKIMETLKGGEWKNDDFIQNVSSNPILAQALKDPRFAMIAQGLQTNPTATMKEIEKDPSMKQVVNELFKVLGGHFMKLGEVQDRGMAKLQVQKPAIVSSEEAKLQREADKVLQNQEIRNVLSNPETKEILNKCSNPVMFRRYMNDPIWGARIRLLQQYGLVQMQN
uniref:STI1/HOP DP domain-containing protein n=1 Tax=Aplanochytrium stocchinoi TaxID=215587 RepID=A0A7S3PN33_9STRA|mmetsp:Transcript_9691/g.12096  ORF Transcript_9691/g.12096 Transcript_9691/m.12096 type:complete len:172 (+) Transcript_9691:160-675(+)